MATIILETVIHAPVEICFDLSRSIDLHIESTKHTGETAIAGKTSGLISLGETVTWRAKHLGIWQMLTSKITEMHLPDFFADEMVEGAFKSFRHEHYFRVIENGTMMKDVFMFESPMGILGELVNLIFLKGYMKRLLEIRNQVIKTAAEKAVEKI